MSRHALSSASDDEVAGFQARSARDVRAADLQEKPTKRLEEPSYISATVVSLDSTKPAAPGEHRSERSEPSDRASLASEAIKLVRAGD
jgi:hypothetical protein